MTSTLLRRVRDEHKHSGGVLAVDSLTALASQLGGEEAILHLLDGMTPRRKQAFLQRVEICVAWWRYEDRRRARLERRPGRRLNQDRRIRSFLARYTAIGCGCSLGTFYRWLRRVREGGLVALDMRVGRPPGSEMPIDPVALDRVAELVANGRPVRAAYRAVSWDGLSHRDAPPCYATVRRRVQKRMQQRHMYRPRCSLN